jgi:hypothetical protein
MPESTNDRSIVTAGLDAQGAQKDASEVQCWEPGLKPSRTGYTSSARTHTRAMFRTAQHRTTHNLNLPAWHKPYAEALLTKEPQALVRLLAAAEIAFFQRILELGDENASDERDDISRAIDVVLDLKAGTQASSRISTGLPCSKTAAK